MWVIGLIFCSALLFSAPSIIARGETTQAAAAAVDVNDSSVCQNLVPSPRLEQFVDELPRLKTILVNNRKQVTLGAYKIKQKLHRDLAPTPLYAFGTSRGTATYPGPTLQARAWQESYVRFENHIHDEEPMFTVDRTVSWANPKRGGVPIVTHLHGAETESISDGNPDAWFTAKGEYGSAYITQNYTYANSQFPTLLWYHDHTYGITRLNILAGLVGLYIIKPGPAVAAAAAVAASRSEEHDQDETPRPYNWLPTKNFEWSLVLADKQFFPNGSINFPNIGDSPKNHPNWCSEYYGDTILVNGKIWPYVRVHAQSKYRFRLLNSANARVFVLSLSNPRVSFVQIGTDGGLLEKPQTVSSITISPAERVDFILDFSPLPVGSEVVMNNSGAAPYPSPSQSLSPVSTKAVMKFIVVKDDSAASQQQKHHDQKKQDSAASYEQQRNHDQKHDSPTYSHEHQQKLPPVAAAGSFMDDHQNLAPIPSILRKPDPHMSIKDAHWRVTNMTEMDDDQGNPIRDLQNNSTWTSPLLIVPVVGSTEVWEFINLTPDAHPMHIHLIQFHFLNQQSFNLSLYLAGGCTFHDRADVDDVHDDDDQFHHHHNRSEFSRSCYTEEAKGPLPNQIGWKDTMLAWPGNVTRIVIKWTSQNGGHFPFNPTSGPGYVWHCHISDHEDNDMLRPFKMQY
jgi:spore coat protein A